ncbi:MAG: outer membrane beta-barrel protein [Deltaproteobacteria bacterium]|nr:outer membrane beta-barrel protein [Deltaproteobacteria bacterium]
MLLNKKIILYLLALAMISLPAQIRADDFKFIPSIDIKGEYNDNIFFDDRNEEEDFITTVSPGLKLSNRTERLNLGLSARFDGISYSDNNKLNAIDQNYKANLNYQLTPETSVGADAGYKKDSRRDRDIEVIDEGTATGLILSDSTRIRSNGGFSLNSMLNETTSVYTSYSFTKDNFDDREDNDLRMHNLNLGLTHNLSFIDELTMGRLNFYYGSYDYLDGKNTRLIRTVTDNSKIDYYSATIGVSRNISEIFSILADIGGNYTKSEYKTRYEYDPINFTQTENNSGSGMVARITTSYNGELTNSSLVFSHDVKASSGTSGATERTTLELNISRRFTYELSGRISTGYYLNKADAGDYSKSGTDETTWRIRPSIRYNFTNDLFMEASYNFTKNKDKEDHTNKTRNQFFIKISMDYPLFE